MTLFLMTLQCCILWLIYIDGMANQIMSRYKNAVHHHLLQNILMNPSIIVILRICAQVNFEKLQQNSKSFFYQHSYFQHGRMDVQYCDVITVHCIQFGKKPCTLQNSAYKQANLHGDLPSQKEPNRSKQNTFKSCCCCYCCRFQYYYRILFYLLYTCLCLCVCLQFIFF